MTRISLSFAVTLLVAACGGSQSDAPTTPVAPAAEAATANDALRPAAEILDAAIEAGGGRDAMLAIESAHTLGRLSIPKAGVEGRLELWQKAPNKSYSEVEIAGIGKTITNCDGENVWELSPMTGDRLVTGAELRQKLRENDIYAEVNWRDHYPTVETLRKEELDGEAAWVVRLVPTEGHESLRWYSVERGLMLATEITAASPMGEIKTRTTFGDWREVDGSLVAFKATQSAMGNEVVISIDTYETNVEIPDDRFAPTPAMQKLLEASAAQAPAPADGAAAPAAPPDAG